MIATALSVAGPAKIPSPGPGPGQTAYVFTAVGTPDPPRFSGCR
ncbi:putative conserved alanine and proline rich protein [Mycobacterium kansasii]|uniref:Putative conserved alanine and proline rich protein n=1 Tax=Mycobacterium kansasii TaxID=1768 RepID=A0A1V3XN11_MYCKA|nr:putative conserved alanine and proline rich protein [Mycobacterium kansasii]